MRSPGRVIYNGAWARTAPAAAGRALLVAVAWPGRSECVAVAVVW